MKSYYRVMLGRQSVHAAECFAGGFIGADYEINQDLSGQLPDEWRQFSKAFIPVFLSNHPDKTKIGAGLACGALRTLSKGIHKGDVVLCPDGTGVYRVGEVIGDYFYAAGQNLPHRRKVQWLPTSIARSAMSEALQKSTGSIGTVSEVSDYRQEIEAFLVEGQVALTVVASDPVVEDPVAFAMEKHLEAFLVANWEQTELAKTFSIYEEDGGRPAVRHRYRPDRHPGCQQGQEAPAGGGTEARARVGRGGGPDPALHGLCEGTDRRGRADGRGGDHCAGRRPELRWALAAVPSISFYRYQVSFKLVKG